ncbi:MAG: helix-turn-helix domain-containing protein [Bryobacteraceae bacterium]
MTSTETAPAVERLLTLNEAAEMLNVTYARAAELARSGLLPTVCLGRQRRISPARLQKWIDAGGQSLPGGWKRSA